MLHLRSLATSRHKDRHIRIFFWDLSCQFHQSCWVFFRHLFGAQLWKQRSKRNHAMSVAMWNSDIKRYYNRCFLISALSHKNRGEQCCIDEILNTLLLGPTHISVRVYYGGNSPCIKPLTCHTREFKSSHCCINYSSTFTFNQNGLSQALHKCP